jgi:hypothetical protein
VSKLLEKLEQISKGNSKPFGFAAAAAKSKIANMVIIAALDDNDKAAVTSAKEYADAILVNSLDGKNTAVKSGLPWGAPISEPAAIKESGCDFILLNTQDSPIALLQEEKLCRMIEIDPAMPDGLIRATNQLPVDIALIVGDTSISMKRLLACQHIANLVGKYLLLRIPLEMSKEELRELWERPCINTTGCRCPSCLTKKTSLENQRHHPTNRSCRDGQRRRAGRGRIKKCRVGSAHQNEILHGVYTEQSECVQNDRLRHWIARSSRTMTAVNCRGAACCARLGL